MQKPFGFVTQSFYLTAIVWQAHRANSKKKKSFVHMKVHMLFLVAALHQPAVEEDLPNCDWINLETNGPSPVAMSVVQQKAQVLSMNVLFVRMAFVAGKISFSRPWMCSSLGGKRPSLIAAIRRSRAPGISLG